MISQADLKQGRTRIYNWMIKYYNNLSVQVWVQFMFKPSNCRSRYNQILASHSLTLWLLF